jgi:hypothetical protein
MRLAEPEVGASCWPETTRPKEEMRIDAMPHAKGRRAMFFQLIAVCT